MMNRTLNRRLGRLETRFRPAEQPMTIQVVFVDGPNKEVVGSFEVQVGGPQPDHGADHWCEGRQVDVGERR